MEDLVEAGELRTRRIDALLERYLRPVRGSGADVIGLGYTHYPFLRHRIKRIMGPGVQVYDPSRPVARRVSQLLAERDGFARSPNPVHRFYTTGDPRRFAAVARKLLRFPIGEVVSAEL